LSFSVQASPATIVDVVMLVETILTAGDGEVSTFPSLVLCVQVDDGLSVTEV
jgi:hypothetical protein